MHAIEEVRQTIRREKPWLFYASDSSTDDTSEAEKEQRLELNESNRQKRIKMMMEGEATMLINCDMTSSLKCYDFRGVTCDTYKTNNTIQIGQESIRYEMECVLQAYEPFTGKHITILNASDYVRTVRDHEKRVAIVQDTYKKVLEYYFSGESIKSLRSIVDEVSKKHLGRMIDEVVDVQ